MKMIKLNKNDLATVMIYIEELNTIELEMDDLSWYEEDEWYLTLVPDYKKQMKKLQIRHLMYRTMIEEIGEDN